MNVRSTAPRNRGATPSWRRWPAAAAVLGLVAAACSTASRPVDPDGTPGPVAGAGAPVVQSSLPSAPAAPNGPLAAEVVAALDRVSWLDGRPRDGDVELLGGAADVRLVWPLLDLLRWEEGTDVGDRALAALQRLTGWGDTEIGGHGPRWVGWTDALLAADVPAPPDYVRWKRAQHRSRDPWADQLYDDVGALDWRQVTWGGVPVGGIATLDDPPVEPAAEADWLREDDLVVGVEIAGAARAYPTRVLDVHELVNDVLGGTPIAVAYCTLCLTATAWDTGAVPGVPGRAMLGTSGLLQRSNKLMVEWSTWSLIGQFDGVAVTGDLARSGVALRQVSAPVSTWADWRAANLDGTVLARPLPPNRNLGDPYDGTFLDDRSAVDPLFPTGPVDPRLPAQEVVLGVDAPRGVAVAFPVEPARAALADGRPVTASGVEVHLVDGALQARPQGGGTALPTRRSYWFAWSQFRPATVVWAAAG